MNYELQITHYQLQIDYKLHITNYKLITHYQLQIDYTLQIDKMKTDNVIVDKSKAFALKVIALYKKLCDTNREFVMSKQLLKSGTSIGANIKEAQQGQSKADFYAKLYIALKEASETEYWLELLHESGYIGEEEFSAIYQDCQEIIKLLVAITKHRGNG